VVDLQRAGVTVEPGDGLDPTRRAVGDDARAARRRRHSARPAARRSPARAT
jgi:hypothetical protein